MAETPHMEWDKLTIEQKQKLVDLFYVRAENQDGKIVFTCTGGEDDEKNWCKSVRKFDSGMVTASKHRSNLYAHLKESHAKTWPKVLSAGEKLKQTVLTKHPKSEQFECWLELSVMERLPFRACESETYRKWMSVNGISRQTLVKYLDAVTSSVADKLAKVLPDKFGLVIDGWTGPASRHYLGIYAVFPQNGKPMQRLLAMAPLLDPTTQSGAEHIKLMDSTLEWYNKDRSNVMFLVADNTNLNPYIARNMALWEAGRNGAQTHWVEFIGCASHRLNLAGNWQVKSSYRSYKFNSRLAGSPLEKECHRINNVAMTIVVALGRLLLHLLSVDVKDVPVGSFQLWFIAFGIVGGWIDRNTIIKFDTTHPIESLPVSLWTKLICW